MPSAPPPEAAARARVAPADLRVAALYVLIVVALGLTGVRNSPVLAGEHAWSAPVSIPLLTIGAASIALRRRAPAVVPFVAGPIAMIELLGGGQLGAYLLLFEALFEPVIHGSRRLARLTTVAGALLTATALIVGWLLTGFGPHLWGILLVATLVVLTPLLWAWEVRHHRRARAGAEALAASEQALARSRAAREVESERRRIAHDLHDVIAGHLAAVSLHTGLAATLAEPEARERSLATAGESSRAALRDLRAMIEVLAEDVDAVPEVTLDWAGMASRLRGGDPAARIDLAGAVELEGRADPAVHAALLRIAAEAVTNAVGHGRAPMELELTTTQEGAQLRIRNALPAEAAVGEGLGRSSILARARAVGGTATAGPLPGSADPPAWEVHAELPLRAAAAGSAVPPRAEEAR